MEAVVSRIVCCCRITSKDGDRSASTWKLNGTCFDRAESSRWSFDLTGEVDRLFDIVHLNLCIASVGCDTVDDCRVTVVLIHPSETFSVVWTCWITSDIIADTVLIRTSDFF